MKFKYTLNIFLFGLLAIFALVSGDTEEENQLAIQAEKAFVEKNFEILVLIIAVGTFVPVVYGALKSLFSKKPIEKQKDVQKIKELKYFKMRV